MEGELRVLQTKHEPNNEKFWAAVKYLTELVEQHLSKEALEAHANQMLRTMLDKFPAIAKMIKDTKTPEATKELKNKVLRAHKEEPPMHQKKAWKSDKWYSCFEKRRK